MRALPQDDTGNFKRPVQLDRPSSWSELPDLVPDLKGKEKLDRAHRGIGNIWNRGHLNMRSHGSRISAEHGCDTHVFANALPQYWSQNQGDWLALEYYTGALANKHGAVWVIAGPVFFKGQVIEMIGAEGETPVALPHAVFKVVVIDKDEKPDVCGFLFLQPSHAVVMQIDPNGGRKRPPGLGYSPCAGTKQANYDFDSFIVPVGRIEALSGIRFFNALDADGKQEALQAQTKKVWKITEKFFGKEKCK